MIALTSQPCHDGPPWERDPGALVLVDWSSWLHKAWALADVDMLPMLVGWLCSMLSYQPAHVAIALDSPGATFRHRMQHPTDEGWRYKGDRPAKPDHFFAICAKATAIAELHAIPCLWADGFEADDVIATATAKARAAGYRVWIATADKDLHQLVDATAGSGLVVGTWDRSGMADDKSTPRAGTFRGPNEVRAKWGVEPAQLVDLLAIMGDSSDNIPGVDGLGPTRAAAILQRYGTLDAALAAPPWDDAKMEEIGRTIGTLAKLTKGRGLCGLPDPAAERRELMARRACERDRVKLCAAAAVARFARDLTALDCDAPVDVPWEEIALGGYDVEALRARYAQIGFTAKAAQVEFFSKPAPWAIPWSGEEAPSAPRRIDGDDDRASRGRELYGRHDGGPGAGGAAARDGRAGGGPEGSDGALRSDGGGAPPRVGDRRAAAPDLRADLPDQGPADGGRGQGRGSVGDPGPVGLVAEPLTDAEEDARDIDAGICRARIRSSAPLGRQYIREDIVAGRRYNLRDVDRAELLRMLDAYDRPARRGAA